MQKKIVIVLLICLVLQFFTNSILKAVDAANGCISYNSSKREILVVCKSANLTEIDRRLGNPHILHEEIAPSSPPSRLWFLNANLVIDKGASMYITSKDTSWLKINSTSGVANKIEVHGGNILIDSVKITSWDTRKNNYATTSTNGSYPRSYILIDNSGSGGQINITNSEIANLGSDHPDGFGVSLNNIGEHVGSKNSSGTLIFKNNKIHDLWYGFYLYNVHRAIIEKSEFYNNSMYGIHAGNKVHDLTIKNNRIFNNQNHGIMCSNGCYNIVIESNKVSRNAKSGIMLYENATDSSMQNNLVYGNKDDQITLYNAHNNKIFNNTLVNGEIGIRVSHNSNNNYIYNNTIANSGQYGVYTLDGAIQNLVANNMINATSMYGIYVQDQKTNNNIFQGNYLFNNKQDAIGLYNVDGSRSFFVRNTIKHTAGFQYSLVNSNLDLVDTDFSPSSIRSLSQSLPSSSSKSLWHNRVAVTYSYPYVLEKITETLARPSSPVTITTGLSSVLNLPEAGPKQTLPSALLMMSYTPLYSLFVGLFVQNGGGYLPSFEYFPLNSPRAFQYPNGPVIESDPNLKIEKVFEGLKFPTTMAFLNQSDILVLEKNNGMVRRIVNGNMLSKPLLRLNVANQGERGMLGIAVAKNITGHRTEVFLYYTTSEPSLVSSSGHSTNYANNTITDQGKGATYNLLYRYELIDNKLVNPKLLLKIPATPGPFHNGGKIVIGPDKALYVVVGDMSGHKTQAENFENGTRPDGTGGILRLGQDGKPTLPHNDTIPGESTEGKEISPLRSYYAYGIRNSFGMDFDPTTKKLWDTENGPNFGDEINVVEPGFNSGWPKVQGIWKPNEEQRGPILIHPDRELVDFGGKGKYRSPEFIWNRTVGLTALKFLNSDRLGMQYKNDMFVGDFHTGTIYHFRLNKERTSLLLNEPFSVNRIANNTTEEIKGGIIFARGFGGITDIQVGPEDGYLYIVALHKGGGACLPEQVNNKPCIPYNSSSLEGTIFRIDPISKKHN